VWEKLLSLLVELWLDRSLKSIRDTLCKFILVDNSYKSCLARSDDNILVDIDVSQGIFESMDLVAGKRIHTQMLDCVNFPFHCVRCHSYGHVLKDCDLSFKKKHRLGREFGEFCR
jgi:hypothetical protein